VCENDNAKMDTLLIKQNQEQESLDNSNNFVNDSLKNTTNQIENVSVENLKEQIQLKKDYDSFNKSSQNVEPFNNMPYDEHYKNEVLQNSQIEVCIKSIKIFLIINI